MIKQLVLNSLFVTTAFSANVIAKCDITGLWEHSSKPAKLFVDLDKGEISVQSHEDNVKAIGLVVLKGLKLDSSKSFWNGKMYSAAEDSFVDVQILPSSCNQLSVRFKNEEILGLLR